MSENKSFLQRVDTLKKEIGSAVTVPLSKFELPTLSLNKIADTNVFPISFPKNCYQFEVAFSAGEKPWDYCKSLEQFGIMAIPFKSMIYAWGEVTKIQERCAGKISGDISTTPLTRESIMEH